MALPRRLFCLLGLAATLSPAAAQPAVADAETFVRTLGSELTTTMAGPGTPADRRRRLQGFLDRVTDIDGLARFCLGRHWNRATQAQQRDYLHEFHDVLVTAVLGRISDETLAPASVAVLRSEVRQDSVLVPTLVTRAGGPPAHVTWVVGGPPGALRLVDVMAEGISLRLTIRSDYAAFLTRNGDSLDALIDALRRQSCPGCAPAIAPASR